MRTDGKGDKTERKRGIEIEGEREREEKRLQQYFESCGDLLSDEKV